MDAASLAFPVTKEKMLEPTPHEALAENEIRVLYILPGSWNDTLRCSLVRHNLVTAKPIYTAISYVWGAPEDPHHLCMVDGIELKIRQNAFRILVQLRRPQESVKVWMDCLCINQNDDLEKSLQIPLMCSIYKCAMETIIWLGENADETGKVAAYIESINVKDIYQEFESGWMASWKLSGKTFVLHLLKDNPRRKSLINGMAQILLAEYFTRVWIRQEAASGGNPHVLWGSHVISWKHIAVLTWIFMSPVTMDWPDWINFRYDRLEAAIDTVLSINARRIGSVPWLENNLPSREAVSLYSLLLWARPGHASIAHDKVYALLSMHSDISRDRLHFADKIFTVDYSLSWQEIYVAATKFFTFDQNSAEYQFLNVAGLQNQGASSDLPSWVPDWRYPTTNFLAETEGWAAGGGYSSVKTKISPLSRKERSQVLQYRGYTSIGPLLELLPRNKCKATSTDVYQALAPEQILPENLACADAACRDKISQADYTYLLSASRAAVVLNIQVSMQDSLIYLSRTSHWQYGEDVSRHRHKIMDIDKENLKFLKEQSIASLSTYITDESLGVAYDTTLICNQDASTKAASADLIASADGWRPWLSDDNADHHATRSSIPYHGAIESAPSFRNYVFGYTASGYMCLVPQFAKVTDEVTIINGYKTPFVVRPVVQDWYMLIGRCYVHGMMTSKASELTEEFSIKVDEKTGQTLIKRPQGDVRANGLKMEAGAYTTILHTLGVRWLKLI